MRLRYGLWIGLCGLALGCFGDAREFGEVLEGMSDSAAVDDDAGESGGFAGVVVEGSDAMGPILNMIAPDFTDETGIEVELKVTDSSASVNSVGEGRTDVGVISRDLNSVEVDRYPDIRKTHYALDGIAVVVNVANPINNLTLEQLADLYSGRATSWMHVGGDDTSVLVFSRPFGSEINREFGDTVLGDTDLRDDAEIVNSNGQMQSGVSGDAGAVAYVGAGFVDETVKIVTVEGSTPDPGTIQGGTYPITRDFFLLIGDSTEVPEDAQAFMEFAAGPIGDAAVETNGYLPVP